MPLLLDLFCCAGGAAMGYHRAGFDVVGVDIEPQPRYPFKFVQADAIELLDQMRFVDNNFDAIHAGPPCQAYSPMAKRHPERNYPDLIFKARVLLRRAGLPYVIENVVGAPLRPDAVGLCGSMFGLGAAGRYLQRHRLFECSFDVKPPSGCRHVGEAIGVYGSGGAWQAQSSVDTGDRGGYQGTLAERQEAMGIDWMVREELAEVIPPAYTEFVGNRLMEAVRGA